MRVTWAWSMAVLLCVTACGDDDGAGPRDAATHDADDPSVTKVTQLVGPEGATIELSDGAKVEIPAGAVSSSVQITLQKLELNEVAPMPETVQARGKAYAFKPHGQAFVNPVKISVPFTGTMDAVRPFKLANEVDDSWEMVPDETKTTNLVSFDSMTFSVIAAAAPMASDVDAAAP